MTRRLCSLAAFSLLAITASCKYPSDASSASDLISLHLAMQRSERGISDREIRSRLGCDPCQVFKDPNGDEFLFRDQADFHVLSAEIEEATVRVVISNGTRVFKLVLGLTAGGAERLNGFGRQHGYGVMSVNEHRGELIGSGTLSAHARYYVAGRFALEADAIRVAESLGVPYRTR